MTYILFLIGFVFLIKWADAFVAWSASIAKKFDVSPLVIWLTIVAFGTSAPELFVNTFSALEWKTDLALWNILWSNIANVLLILWMTSIIFPIKAQVSTVYKEIPFWLLAVVVLWIVCSDVLLDWWTQNLVSRIDGLVFLCFFAIFLVYTFSMPKSKADKEIEKSEIEEMSLSKSILFFLVWMLWLAIWWDWIVDWATYIASNVWISESTIGLTIVALGTALPEIVTSITAALKKETDMALGNIVWSTVFNTFFILWITAIINPIEVSQNSYVDIYMCISATLILMSVMFFWKEKYTIERKEGIMMVFLYILYLLYIILF